MKTTIHNLLAAMLVAAALQTYGYVYYLQSYGGVGSAPFPINPEPAAPVEQVSPGVYLVADGSSDGGFQAMDSYDLPYPGGTNDDGGTNQPYLLSYQPLVYGSNDLWLSISSVSNGLAQMVIHEPPDLSSNWWDVLYSTNLATPLTNWWPVWTATNGQTNLLVPDAAAQGFYALRARDAADEGTNFWVDYRPTPQELAQWIVGNGVVVSNAQYTGAPTAIGIFGGGDRVGLSYSFLLAHGVMLASGDIANAIGPNDVSYAATNFGTMGDADLANLVGGGNTEDAAVLEFDIFPTNSFSLQFQYIYASEEYPEFIGQYNDPMAIFVSTHYAGTNRVNSITNDIALVPGMNLPVSVNSINGGCATNTYGVSVPATNPQYYTDNDDPYHSALPAYAASSPVYDLQYDGFTVLLTAQTNVSANVTYHVKIAIADYQDALYDSAIFVKTQTFPYP